MGNSASQTVKEYVTNSATYSQVVSAELDLANKTSVNTSNMQSFNLNIGGKNCPPCCRTWNLDQTTPRCAETWPPSECPEPTLDCSDINVTQTIQQETAIVQSIDSEFAQQLSAQLQNTAQADIQNAMKQLQENDPGWTGEWDNSTDQDVETSIMNEISENLNSSTVMSLVNQVLISTVNTQEQAITICGIMQGDTCNFNQNIGVSVVVQNILTSLADQVAKGELTNKFYSQIKNKLSQEQEGAVGAAISALSKLGSLAIILLVGGGLLFFLIIVAVVVLIFFKGGGKEASQTLAQTLAQNPELFMA